jgi:hypothetical protein
MENYYDIDDILVEEEVSFRLFNLFNNLFLADTCHIFNKGLSFRDS